MAKNIVISGAGRGIGLELTRQYSTNGENVFALCRKASTELKNLNVKVIEDCDVTSTSSVKRAFEKIDCEQIDILINNAGLLVPQSLENWEDADFEAMLNQFQVNSLGPLRVANAFMSKFGPGTKLAFITSRMGSIEDNTSGAQYGYRMSKCALNIACRSLALDLKNEDVAVAILHPGYVKTEMTGFNGMVTPERSAEMLIERIKELNISSTGTFWHANGEVLPW